MKEKLVKLKHNNGAKVMEIFNILKLVQKMLLMLNQLSKQLQKLQQVKKKKKIYFFQQQLIYKIKIKALKKQKEDAAEINSLNINFLLRLIIFILC